MSADVFRASKSTDGSLFHQKSIRCARFSQNNRPRRTARLLPRDASLIVLLYPPCDQEVVPSSARILASRFRAYTSSFASGANPPSHFWRQIKLSGGAGRRLRHGHPQYVRSACGCARRAGHRRVGHHQGGMRKAREHATRSIQSGCTRSATEIGSAIGA
eukprot:6172456-Pleurochrysis_carterae.AAC.2